jgi:hypothetical protein
VRLTRQDRPGAGAITTLRTAPRSNTSTIPDYRSGGGSLSFAGVTADPGSAENAKSLSLDIKLKAVNTVSKFVTSSGFRNK